jgi:hypothetical glycosyl hydrolase
MEARLKEKIKYIDNYNIAESAFHSQELAKTESIMCLGNGYLGLRSCAEESYLGQSRGLFIAGTFNKFDDNEVTELPNCADVVGTDILFDNELLDLTKGKVTDYEKKLDLKTGLLTRRVNWEIGNNKYFLDFDRFVSDKDLHVIGQKIKVSSDKHVSIKIVTGINGRMTNSGSQHFTDGQKRFFDKRYIQMAAQTTQSKINVIYTLGLNILINGKEIEMKPNVIIDRRRILIEFSLELPAFQYLEIEKIVDVRTDRDLDNHGLNFEQIQQKALTCFKNNYEKGYSVLLQESIDALDLKLWSRAPIKICSKDPFDQLAVNFARYHLHIMTPAHDSRMNIGAKGLSGEGYKGHTFWDTEIFALPYFIFSNPETAKKLVEYRYLSLGGARRKAKENGYEGAQFPWESAWLEDGEVTPEWGPVDIVTGLPLKIESGIIEQHITSDVAFGVWQYYMATGDEQFLLDCGYELILETAKFWTSRLELNEEDHMFHINDVMGPDEFKEHVDDNAFTNYMAWWNIKLAIKCYDILLSENKELFDKLDKKINLKNAYHKFKEKADRIYLPKPGIDNILPQDKTYLTLKCINLDKYKNGNHAGGIYRDYNSDQISQIQVSKQADVMMLFFLMEDLFSLEVKRASWNYYEPKTIHDSSLSLSTHAILASDLNNTDLAYSLFHRACNIDLGENMYSCNDGIHAAAMAGIWQAAVFGFAGVRLFNGNLRIVPHLPKEWESCELVLYWQAQMLKIMITHKEVSILNTTNHVPTEIYVIDEIITFDGSNNPIEIAKQINY